MTQRKLPERDPKKDAPPKKRDDIKRDDEIVDETGDDSFPASDPPSYSGATGGKTEDDD